MSAMTSEHHFLASVALSLGVPLILALRELVLLRRPPDGGPPPPPEPPPEPKPLPDCLRPKPMARPRLLEDA